MHCGINAQELRKLVKFSLHYLCPGWSSGSLYRLPRTVPRLSVLNLIENIREDIAMIVNYRVKRYSVLKTYLYWVKSSWRSIRKSIIPWSSSTSFYRGKEQGPYDAVTWPIGNAQLFLQAPHFTAFRHDAGETWHRLK